MRVMVTPFASHFVFHPCLNVDHFENRSDREYPALYIHHFFPDASKCTAWGDSFKVHIHFIPTTFEVYVDCEGLPTAELVEPPPLQQQPLPPPLENGGLPIALGDSGENIAKYIISELQTKQGLFPGGFIGSEKLFVNLLENLEQAASAVTAKRGKAESLIVKTEGGATNNSSTASQAPAVGDDTQNSAQLLSLSGRVMAQAEADFKDNLGENKIWIVECNLMITE